MSSTPANSVKNKLRRAKERVSLVVSRLHQGSLARSPAKVANNQKNQFHFLTGASPPPLLGIVVNSAEVIHSPDKADRCHYVVQSSRFVGKNPILRRSEIMFKFGLVVARILVFIKTRSLRSLTHLEQELLRRPAHRKGKRCRHTPCQQPLQYQKPAVQEPL